MAHLKDEIISEIERVATSLGVHTLRRREFDRHSGTIKSSAARYHFGSWNAAVEAAGLTRSDPMENIGKKDVRITDDDLLLDLLRLYKEIGKTTTEAWVNSVGQFSSRPYKRRFSGVWKAFLLAQNRFPDAVPVGHVKSQTRFLPKLSKWYLRP